MDQVNPRERAMYDYIRFLAANSLPLTTLGKATFRGISKYQYRFGTRPAREAMLKLVEVVEFKTDSEMRETK